MLKGVHLLISGKVQGVFFRHSTAKKARELKLTGWVKNLPEGSAVEVFAEGECENLKELVKWCYNGPKGAIVKKVETVWHKCENKFDQFDILL